MTPVYISGFELPIDQDSSLYQQCLGPGTCFVCDIVGAERTSAG